MTMIFLSYCHKQSDYADKVEEYLQQHHVPVLRDKKSEKETDSISEFVRKVGSADYVILLVSDAYLKSYWCLYEALIAYNHRDRRNMIPVLMPDVELFASGGPEGYLSYWENMCAEYERRIAARPPQETVELQKELRQIQAYSNYLGDFMAYLKDTVCILREDGEKALEKLYACLCEKLLAREVRYRSATTGRHPDPMQLPEDPYLAIDFGTSYTLLSVADRRGKIHLIPDRDGSSVHRSTIEFHANGDYLIGTDGSDVVRHIKRAIGVRSTVNIGREPWSVTLLTAMILKSMVRNAEEYLGIPIRRVIMAIPTDFSLAQRGILLESARIAGVEVKRFIQESSAEAYLASPDGEHLAAFIDMGGGTLDISLAEVLDGMYSVYYSDGDSNFGSLDFDDVMEELLEKKLLAEYGIRGENLGTLAEQIKCRLSDQDSVSVTYLNSDSFGDVQMLPLTVSRQDFEAEARPLIARFEKHLNGLRSTVDECYKFWKQKLEVVYLTGQGTKLYVLKKLIAEKFPEIQIVDRYQESAVIRGLSIQNRIFMGDLPDILLLNSLTSKVVVKYAGDGEDDSILLSVQSNPKECELKEKDRLIPFRTSIALAFEDQPETSASPAYPLEIIEVTASGRRNLLVCTSFTPDPAKRYELTLESDANARVIIRVDGFDEMDARETIFEYHF